MTYWFWPLSTLLCVTALIAAVFSRVLGAVSISRVNDYRRRRGRPGIENGEMGWLDNSSRFFHVVEEVSKLCLAALLASYSVVYEFSLFHTLMLFLGLVAFILVLLELVPHAVAATRPEKILDPVLPAVCVLGKAFVPLTRVYEGGVRFLVRGAGGDVEKHTEQAVEEEILSAVEEGEREGVIQHGGKDMIESIISFYDQDVEEVMTPRTSMVCIPAETSLSEGLAIATKCGHSRIPVYRGNKDRIVGILYVKDFLKYFEKGNWDRLQLGELVRKAYFIPTSKKISALFQEFRKHRFHIAVVLDEYGGTAGLVTIEDILEEIVGEIADEFELQKSPAKLRNVDEDTYEVDGVVHIDELNENLGLELPEEDWYETLAGFLFALWGRVPEVGERKQHDGVDFQVTDADERRIKTVRIHKRKSK